jgi:hypothetical protein
MRGQLRRSLDDIYSHHLESPGTKAYSIDEVWRLFAIAGFKAVKVRVQLSPRDLLQSKVNARHRGSLLKWTKVPWPRQLIKRLAPGLGLYLLVEAVR